MQQQRQRGPQQRGPRRGWGWWVGMFVGVGVGVVMGLGVNTHPQIAWLPLVGAAVVVGIAGWWAVDVEVVWMVVWGVGWWLAAEGMVGLAGMGVSWWLGGVSGVGVGLILSLAFWGKPRR